MKKPKNIAAAAATFPLQPIGGSDTEVERTEELYNLCAVMGANWVAARLADVMTFTAEEDSRGAESKKNWEALASQLKDIGRAISRGGK